MQFTLNVFRNSTDVILSSAFLGPYEFLKIEGITSKGGNLTQFQSTSMDRNSIFDSRLSQMALKTSL